MKDGYWVVRTYESGIIGEKTKFWIQGARPKSKSRRKEKSDIRKQEQNEYSSVKTLARLLHANFQHGDILLGLDYSDKGLDKLEAYARKSNEGYESFSEEEKRDAIWQAAKHEVSLCLRRVNRELQKQGKESIKSITVTSDMDGDTGELVRAHHHLVVPAGSEGVFKSKWSKLGGVAWSPLSKQADYTPVAEYLLRQVRRIPDANKYVSSRNLIRPQPKDRVVESDAELRVPKGGKLLHRQEYKVRQNSEGGIYSQPQYIRYIIPEHKRKKTKAV
jgi:hypothetical protein